MSSSHDRERPRAREKKTGEATSPKSPLSPVRRSSRQVANDDSTVGQKRGSRIDGSSSPTSPLSPPSGSERQPLAKGQRGSASVSQSVSRSGASSKNSLSIPSIGRESISVSGSASVSLSGHGLVRKNKKQSIHEDDEKYIEYLKERERIDCSLIVAECKVAFIMTLITAILILGAVGAAFSFLNDPVGTTFFMSMPKIAFIASVIAGVVAYNTFVLAFALSGNGTFPCWRWAPNKEFWLATPDRSKRMHLFLTNITLWMLFTLNLVILISVCLTFRLNFMNKGTAVTADAVTQAVVIICYLVSFPVFYRVVKEKFQKRHSVSDLDEEDESYCYSC